MADPRDLAEDLRDCLAPNETILWHSRAATIKHLRFRAFLAVSVLDLFLILGLWLKPFGAFHWPHDGYWIIGLLALFAVLSWIALVKAAHSAVVLTSTDLYVRRAIPNSPISRIARADVREASLFEHDGTVLLDLIGGNRERLNASGTARELVKAMVVPAKIWKAHDGPAGGGIIAWGLLGAAPAMLHIVGSVVFDLLTGEGLPARWYLIPIVLVAGSALLLIGHWLRARRLDEDERRRAACILLDPRWRGCDPYSSGHIPAWQIPRAVVTLWLVKAFYGMPTDCTTGHEPEIIDPRPAAAAE